MATTRPATVASSAEAMPGAMALTLTSPAAAMAAKVIITPATVPSRPRKGPPEMAMVSSTMLELRRCDSRTRSASTEARTALSAAPESTGVAPPDLALVELAHAGTGRACKGKSRRGPRRPRGGADRCWRLGSARGSSGCRDPVLPTKIRLGHHHPRRQHEHQAEDGYHDPGVGRQVAYEDGEVAGTGVTGLAGGFALRADQLGFGTLRGGEQADPVGAACCRHDLQLVEQAAVPGTNGQRPGERRQGRIGIAGARAVDVEGRLAAGPPSGQYVPTRREEGCRPRSASRRHRQRPCHRPARGAARPTAARCPRWRCRA